MDFLTFNFNNTSYAIPLQDVDEVLMMSAYESIANAPEFIAGMLNLRGDLLPVIDCLERLNIERNTIAGYENIALSHFQTTCRILIVNIPITNKQNNACEAVRVAVIIDGWQGLQQIAEQELRTSVLTDKAVAEFIHGISIDATSEHKVRQCINIKKILTANELALLKKTQLAEVEIGELK